jgi:hypothetical protein
MSVVQSTYEERIAQAVAGQVANETDWSADTGNCETEAGIGFGVVVGQGAADKGVVLGAATAAGFRGVSLRDVTLPPSQVDKYAKGQNVGILNRGDIWVTVGAAVQAGENATFVATTGVLSSAASSGSQFEIAGARWMTSAAPGGLAMLRLSGHLPSA